MHALPMQHRSHIQLDHAVMQISCDRTQCTVKQKQILLMHVLMMPALGLKGRFRWAHADMLRLLA